MCGCVVFWSCGHVDLGLGMCVCGRVSMRERPRAYVYATFDVRVPTALEERHEDGLGALALMRRRRK